MMYEEGLRKSSGRRSKLEIVCDILTVISKGIEKPTRVMQLANVTWDDLIMYLEALIRNHLLLREMEGKRVKYALTPKGSSLLDLYLKLKQEASLLGLETISRERISKALKAPTAAQEAADLYPLLERRLRALGFKILENKVVGKKSKAVHTFGIVAQDRNGSRHAYTILSGVDEVQVMRLFVTQLDTDISLHVFYSGQISPEAETLARSYSLALSPWQEA